MYTNPIIYIILYYTRMRTVTRRRGFLVCVRATPRFPPPITPGRYCPPRAFSPAINIPAPIPRPAHRVRYPPHPPRNPRVRL